MPAPSDTTTHPATTSIIPRLAADATIASLDAAIDEAGAVIVERLLDDDLVDRLRADLDPWLAATEPGSRSGDPEWELFHGTRTVRFDGVAAKTNAFADVALHEVVLGLTDRRLIPDGGATQISDTQVISIGPGEPAQYLHRDQTAWPWFNQLLPDGPELIVVAMVALTDFTAENGATRLVPGSHLLPDSDELFDGSRAVAAEMPAGSVLFFSGKTIHGGGPNSSDRARTALHLGFAQGWLRAEEAHAFTTPLDVAARLPRRAQQLLGFGEYNPAPAGGGRLNLIDFEDPARQLFGHESRNRGQAPIARSGDLAIRA